jgi:hypothetical protein
MPKLLCKTIETFNIEGRGTIVVLQDPEDWRIPPTEVVKRREAIRILRPDQSSVKTFIKDFEFIRKFGGGSGVVIQLPNDVSVDDVPPESLVFLEREDDEPILWDGRKAEFTKAEQGVAPQSATRSELESEGGDKPQPESEPRPR